MHTTVVHIQVKPESIEAFIVASEKNHRASVQEPENSRFDLLQEREDSTRFILYEAYATAAGAAAHKETAHYLEWREEVAEMMATPRRGVGYEGLCPAS